MNKFTQLNKNILFNLLLITTVIIILYLIYNFGILELKNQVNKLGLWAPLAIFILRSASIIFPALPSTAYSILAGGILGFEKGLITICLADLTSCSISFFISRNYGKNIVRSIIGDKFIDRIERLSKNHIEDNFFLMTGFLMTGLFDFVCYAVGLTKVSWRRFAMALSISIFISNPPVVALGAGLLDGGKRIVILAIVGILILGTITSIVKNKQSLI